MTLRDGGGKPYDVELGFVAYATTGTSVTVATNLTEIYFYDTARADTTGDSQANPETDVINGTTSATGVWFPVGTNTVKAMQFNRSLGNTTTATGTSVINTAQSAALLNYRFWGQS